jgi:hypothetical protein
MRKMLFASLCAVICALIFLPVSEAIQRGQTPNGPRREGAPNAARTKNKAPRKEAKSAAKSPVTQEALAQPVSITATEFGTSAKVSDIAAQSSAVVSDVENEQQEASENRDVRFVTEAAKLRAEKMGVTELARTDRALQADTPTLNIPSPLLTFEGNGRNENIAAGFGNLSPPDTNGDVGPNHYVQQTNLLVRVWNKAGVPLTAPFRLSSLWAIANGGPGGQCSAPDAGDPIVLYDPLADRWLLSQFAYASQTAAPYHQCIAISKTSDPTGAYYLYDFITGGTTGGNEFPDYPHLGVWPDGYYMMVHQFTLGGPFNGTGAYSFNRAKMLAGDATANYIYFNLNLASHPEGIGGGLFADLDGLNPPPVGAPDIFAYLTATDFGDPANGIRLFNFHADFAVPANSTFIERPESSYAAPVPVAAFSLVNPAGRRDVPQPAPAAAVTASLDSISDRFMHRMQYRNRGGFETLVLSHTVGAPASTVFGTYRASPRYYELRNSGAGYAVNEQATFAPGGSPGDSISRWMSSAAEDNQGNLAVGYSVSSGAAGGNVRPGIRYAGRLATDPPNGLFQGEGTLITGTGVQTSTGNRWGDYSALTVDPSDDCTFWYTQEYYTAAGQAASAVGWQTRIGAFSFTQCTAPQMGTLAGTITFCDSGAPIPGALITVDGTLYAATAPNGTYSIKLPPGSHSVIVSAAGQSCNSKTQSVSISNGATTTFDTCLSGSANVAIQSQSLSGGDGNGVINRDECNNLNITLTDNGCASLTNVFAILSTTTPGVTVTQPNSPYPNIPSATSAVNTAPFNISTSPAFACGTVINFSLKVKSDQGTFTRTFTMPTCVAPTINVSGSIAAGDASQTGRLNRNGVASSCAVPKATQPLFDTNPRRYDSYTFTNSGSVPACVTVNVTSGCGTNLFYATYLGSFNPANIQQNYLADPGASFAGVATWSFNVPAGATFVLVIHEVALPLTGCASYTASVSGLFTNASGGGECTPNFCDVTCPSDITQGSDPGQCGAVVNYATPTTGVCGTVTCDHPSGSFFPVGTTPVTCTSQAEDSCSFNVTVNDTGAPTIGPLTVDQPSLWPANHQLIPVTVSYAAADNCSVPTCTLSGTSSEPDNGLGDGDTANDIQIVDNHHVLLRAERSGKGNGRTYTLRATCTDSVGNSTTSGPVNVIVSHDMRSAGPAFKDTYVDLVARYILVPGRNEAYRGLAFR